MKNLYSSTSIAKIVYVLLFLIFLTSGTYAAMHNNGWVALFSGIFAGVTSTSLVQLMKDKQNSTV